MKKVIKAKSLLVIGFLALFISCKKEDRATSHNISNPKQGNHIQFADISNWDDAANPANPYDDAGLTHNLALKFILDSLEVDSLKPLPIYNVAVAYAYSLGTTVGDDFTTDVTYSWLNNLYVNNFSWIDDNTDLDDVIDGMSFATNISTKLKDLYDFPDTTIQDYDSVKRKIVAWEQSVLISMQFTNSEKETLLRHASVMRYSLLGWMNATFPNTGSGHITFKTTSWRTFWNCVKVVACDAVGAVAVGVVTGGTGAAVGAAGASGMAAHLIHNP